MVGTDADKDERFSVRPVCCRGAALLHRSLLHGAVAWQGSRKPNGDAANTRNGHGQETWMKTIDKADPIRPGYPAAA